MATQVTTPTLRLNDVYKFVYSPKKEWGFDGRTWCFEGYLIVTSDLQLVDTYWGIGNSSGRVIDAGTVAREVENGGRFEFYFNLDEVDAIPNGDSNYYADDDLFYVSEQHACSDTCRHTFKRRSATRNADKMLAMLREQLLEAARKTAQWTRHHERITQDIQRLESGDLTVHIDG